jgi:hypothetical protein
MKRVYAQRTGSPTVHYWLKDHRGERTRCGRKVTPGRWGIYEGHQAIRRPDLCADCERYEQSDRSHHRHK